MLESRKKTRTPFCWEAGNGNTDKDGVSRKGNMFEKEGSHFQIGFPGFEMWNSEAQVWKYKAERGNEFQETAAFRYNQKNTGKAGTHSWEVSGIEEPGNISRVCSEMVGS